MARDSRYLWSAKLIAFCTLISRVTGLVRDITINHFYGQNWVQDAFNYGFQIPNLFRRLFGEGALSAIFIPVFTETLDRKGKPEGWVLLGRVAGLLVLVLCGATIFLELGVLAIWHFHPGGPMRTLQLGLTAVMMPFMISICMLALLSSILNCLHHFTAPALMPIVLNVMNIIGVLFIGPLFGEALEKQIYGVAISVLAASVLQIVLILPVLRAHGVKVPWSLEHRHPEVRRIARMFLPVVLGQGVLLFSVYFDAQICTSLTRGPQDGPTFSIGGHAVHYPLAEGALSAVTNAQRLYQFPLGVLAISLATAVFPMFSLYASREDYAGLRETLGQSIRVAIFEGLPSGIMMILLAEPIVALLFQHGRFGPDATARAAWVLKWYGLGMPAFCAQHILLRGFYSLKDTLTPMWIGCSLVVINMALSLSLVWHPAIREAAFGISTSTTATMHVLVSVWLLRRRMRGRIGARAIVKASFKMLVAGALAGAMAWWLARWTAGMHLSALGKTGTRAVEVFIPLAGAGLVYLGVAKLMRAEEIGWLWGVIAPLPTRRRYNPSHDCD
jgi:putative peptidoglycan lipid II flippase